MAIQAGAIQLGVGLGGPWTSSFGTPSSGPLADYQTWWNTGGATGHQVQAARHYTYGSWATSSFTTPWAQLNAAYNAGVTCIMGMGGLPTGGTVANLLAGQYDTGLAQMGAAMAPYPDMILDFAFEGNGDWFAWSAGVLGVGPYQQMWNYAIPKLRAAGYTGHISLSLETYGGRTPQTTAAGIDPSLYDLVACDDYATTGTQNSTDVIAAWTNIQLPTFDNAAKLASSQGKRLIIPEFGPMYRQNGYGMGDDDYFLTQFASWLQKHDVAVACIFNHDDDNPSTSQTTVNRIMLANPAVWNQAGPFTDNSAYFPKCIPVWKSSTWTAKNLAYAPATKTVAPPLQAARKRTTRMPFA